MEHSTPEDMKAGMDAWIIQAESLDAATKLLEDHPHLHQPDGKIDVFETLPMPGT